MSDHTRLVPNTNFPLVSGPSATAAAIRSAKRSDRRWRRSTRWRCSAKSARGASTFTTTISCRSTPRPPSATASSRNSRRPAPGTASSCRWRRSTCSSIRCFVTAPSPRTTRRVRAYADPEDDARDGPWARNSGAKIFVLWGGREGTETDACRRPDEAVKRLREAHQLSVRVFARQEVRLPVRARSQAQRAARRHLHGDDRQLPRVHPDARAPELVGVNPEVAHETDGRPELPARRRAGVGSRQAVPHRSERPGARPLRSGLPLRRRQHQGGVLPRQVPRGCRLRRPAPLRRACVSHRGLRRRQATSRAAACGPT